MNKINFSDITKCHDIESAQRLYPSVAFCNKMIDSSYNHEIMNKLIKESYSNWIKGNDMFPHEVIKEYFPRIPKGLLSKGADEETIIVFWLSYLMGEYCSSKNIDEIYPLLSDLYYTIEGRGFLYSFLPNEEMIDGMINKIDFSPQSILKRSRYVGGNVDIDAILAFYSNISQEKVIYDICQGVLQADYYAPPGDVALLLDLLIQCESYDKWVGKVMNMRYPYIQITYCETIRDPEILLKLYEASCKYNKKETTLLRCILVKIWMDALVSQQYMYSQSIEKKRYDKEVIKTYEKHKGDFNGSLDKSIKEAVSLFNMNEDKGVLFNWIFCKEKRENPCDINNAYNLILEKVKQAVKDITKVNDFNIKNADLHRLAVMSQLLVDSNHSSNKLQELREKVLEVIKDTNSYIHLDFSENNIQEFRAFAKLFADADDFNINELEKKGFFVKYEGINATNMKNWGNVAIKECYVFCILLMISEIDLIDEKKRVVFFREVTSKLIKQGHCCGMDYIVKQNYQIPLILAELIADQILHECKESFEEKISKEIYDMGVVMKTLSFANLPIAKKAIDEICKYRDGSWQEARRKYLNKKMQNEVAELEKLFTIICK